MTTSTLTAIITARGDATTVPDRPDAVDAEIWVGPDYLCAVTLLEDRGTLSAWGSPDNWCSDWGALVAAAGEDHPRDGLIAEIVAAVQEADLAEDMGHGYVG